MNGSPSSKLKKVKHEISGNYNGLKDHPEIFQNSDLKIVGLNHTTNHDEYLRDKTSFMS